MTDSSESVLAGRAASGRCGMSTLPMDACREVKVTESSDSVLAERL